MLENRFVEKLPFDEQDLSVGQFQLAGRVVLATEVVERLLPLLTAARVARIDQVIEQRTSSVGVVVEHIYDIGNISAVMRSAESFGFLPFHIIERPGSRYKMSDRISRGTEKWLNIKRHQSTSPGLNPTISCFDQLKASGFKIYVTDLNATTSIEAIDLSQKIAVVLGNEHDGISPSARESADGSIMLPMYGFAQSFNISVAAALTFSHIHRARIQQLGQSGDLSGEQKLNLRAQYFLRTIQNADAYFK